MDQDTAEVTDKPKYWAFISYSHADRAWGEWLHRKLERFRIPQSMVDEKKKAGIEIPARMFPVFLDRFELPASSSLNATIDAALADAMHLVVVCSPTAAVSHWVNEEIVTFRRRNGPGGIFCFIVAGEPNATAGSGQLEALPAPLRELGEAQPLAPDARPHADGKERALVKLVAGMWKLEFDQLWRRERRLRRRRRASLAATATVVLATVFGVWFNRQQAFQQQRERAVAQRIAALSLALANSEDPATLEQSALLAIHSLRRFDAIGLRSLDADGAVRNALAFGHARLWEGATHESLEAIAYSENDDLIGGAAWADAGRVELRRWNARSGTHQDSALVCINSDDCTWDAPVGLESDTRPSASAQVVDMP